MGKQNKLLQYIIFGVPAAIAVYLIYKSLKGKKGQDAAPEFNPEKDNGKTEPTSSGQGVSPVVKKYFPLKKGSRGAKVKELQEAILSYNASLLPKFGADSDFGTETEAAVKSLLKKVTVDNQEEIEKIKGLKGAEVANTNRVALANAQLGYFNSNPKSDWFAIEPTTTARYKVLSDGRVPYERDFNFKKGDKMGLRSPLIKNLTVAKDSIGFLYATYDLYNDKSAFIGKFRMKFSPYAFEIK